MASLNLSKQIGLYTVTIVNSLTIEVSFILEDDSIYCKHYKSKKSALKHFEWVSVDIWWHHKNNMAWEYTGLIPKVFLVGSLNNEKHASYFVGYKNDSVERVILELFGEKIMAWTVSGLRGSEATSGVFKLMCDRINKIKLLKV
jgi:hypothetical protein